MSPTITSVSRSTQERILSAIDLSQSKPTNAVSTVSGTVAKVLPSQLSVVRTLPGRVGVPTRHEAVELTWGFAQELVARQRAFADDLVEATAPAVDTES